MLKKSSIILYILVSLFVFNSGCEKEAPIPVEPERPSNIPQKSIWVGGIDGGVFVRVKKLAETANDIYYAEVYYVSGDLAYKGLMKIYPSGASFDINKKESYEGWDGDNIYLSKNRHLQIQE
jgi:hypothetical protein